MVIPSRMIRFAFTLMAEAIRSQDHGLDWVASVLIRGKLGFRAFSHPRSGERTGLFADSSETEATRKPRYRHFPQNG